MEKQESHNRCLIVNPTSNGNLISPKGELLSPPAHWSFLQAGDAGITRKITSKEEYWKVEVTKGKRKISLGIWASNSAILQAQKDVKVLRSTTEYQNKKIYTTARRNKIQSEYEVEFCKTVVNYLNFHPNFKELELKLAKAITNNAIPIGSGTVARTKQIPLEQRATLAVIAWMRHQTTTYDYMQIAHVKGERRAIRKSLAIQSELLLTKYRNGEVISSTCILQNALSNYKNTLDDK